MYCHEIGSCSRRLIRDFESIRDAMVLNGLITVADSDNEQPSYQSQPGWDENERFDDSDSLTDQSVVLCDILLDSDKNSLYMSHLHRQNDSPYISQLHRLCAIPSQTLRVSYGLLMLNITLD